MNCFLLGFFNMAVALTGLIVVGTGWTHRKWRYRAYHLKRPIYKRGHHFPHTNKYLSNYLQWNWAPNTFKALDPKSMIQSPLQSMERYPLASISFGSPLNNFPRIPQKVCGRTRIWTQTSWIQAEWLTVSWSKWQPASCRQSVRSYHVGYLWLVNG